MPLPSISMQCMRLRPDRNVIMGVFAVCSAAFWLISSAVGSHPDGAILGFSSTMFAVWATNERQEHHARQRARRSDRQRRRTDDVEEKTDDRTSDTA